MVFWAPLLLSLCSALAVWRLIAAGAGALARAESTLRRRAQHAKYCAAVTSSKKARKYGIPHFSLKNVDNIKFWLAIRGSRAWLKRDPQQRSSDAIVSGTFFFCLVLLSVLVVEFLVKEARFGAALAHWELLALAALASAYLVRYLALGARVHRAYADMGVVYTEQVNGQLRLLRCSRQLAQAQDRGDAREQARLREKRERLQISNNVLKLSTKLLKEVGSPHQKIAGLALDPALYNVARVVVVSALSALTSEMLGFKLKIWQLFKFK